MKKNLICGLIILGGLIMCPACSDDTPEQQEPQEQPVEQARYYVKYEVEFTTQHTNTKKNITFQTDKGPETISFTEWTKTKSWEGTYGPVDKDFEAFIQCSVTDYRYESNIHARIYISREKEPFVIKAEGTGEYSLNLQTTIDF